MMGRTLRTAKNRRKRMFFACFWLPAAADTFALPLLTRRLTHAAILFEIRFYLIKTILFLLYLFFISKLF